jgi:hypothetical protein
VKPARALLSREFQRSDIRADFEKARRAMRSEIAEMTPEEAILRLVELGDALDGGVARIKRDLLGTALCWNEENQALTAWICNEHQKMGEMCHQLLDASSRRVSEKTLEARLAASALLHWGEAVKWSTSRERQNYVPLHSILARMAQGGRHRQVIRLVADGRGRSTSIEALYFRALLLDRFGGGNLTRQQIEVLDAWLWEWTASLTGVTTPPAGAAFRADLDGNAGLREGTRSAAGPSLYLPLAPLEACRRDVIRELHQGRIVPPHGCAADMRVEEHVAVLDQLQRAFEAAGADSSRRAERLPGAGTRLEVWVGLTEILTRGVTVEPVTKTGSWKVADDVRAAIASNNRNHPALGIADDPSRRYLWLTDVSATGFGFEALGRDAAGIEVGDLLGWKKVPGAPCVIGKVVRRIPGSSKGQIFFGVELLTQAAVPLKLVEEVGERALSENVCVFVPGTDDGGRHDAFLLPDKVQRDFSSFSARSGNDVFKLRFNRVRNKGRGWVLAGFEIVTAEQEGRLPAPIVFDNELTPLPTFDFPAEAQSYDEAWGREIGSRLLN